MRRSLAILLLSACAHPEATREPRSHGATARARRIDQGSRRDVRTTSTTIDGVEIVVPCPVWGDVGVIGDGDIAPPSAEDRAAYDAWVHDLRDRTQRALGPPVVHVGWGVTCRWGEIGPTVYVDHHRDVDPTVLRLAAFVREQRLRLPFLVLVSPVADPL